MERLCIEFILAETRKIEYCIFAGLRYGGLGVTGARCPTALATEVELATDPALAVRFSRAVGAGGVRAQRAGYPMVTRERERHPLPIPCP